MRVFWYAVGFAFLDIFPLSFYGESLRERINTGLYSVRLCIPALLNVITLLILIVTITVVAGIYLGTTSWFKEYVETKDRPRIIEINANSNAKQLQIHSSTLKKLERITDSEGRRAVQHAFGWNDVPQFFCDHMGSQENGKTIIGRTVDPADPLLDSLETIWSSGDVKAFFQKQGLGEIVVSKSMLKELGYDTSRLKTQPPRHVFLYYNGMPGKVGIKAVCQNIRGQEMFLITTGFERRLRDQTWQPLDLYRQAYLGPIGGGVERIKFESAIRSYLLQAIPGMMAELVGDKSRGRELRLKYGLGQDPKPMGVWRDAILPLLKKKFPAELGAVNIRFEKTSPADDGQSDPEKISYLKASVYVEKLEQVPDVADALGEMGFVDRSDAKGIARIFIQLSSFGQGVIYAVIFTVGLLTCISISLSFAQRIQRKTSEIGILKAFGTNNFLIFIIYSLEALMLWALAMLLSWGVVYFAAAFVNHHLVEIFSSQAVIGPSASGVNIVTIPAWLLLLVGAGSLLLCWLATMVSGMWAVRMQPAQAIKTETS